MPIFGSCWGFYFGFLDSLRKLILIRPCLSDQPRLARFVCNLAVGFSPIQTSLGQRKLSIGRLAAEVGNLELDRNSLQLQLDEIERKDNRIDIPGLQRGASAANPSRLPQCLHSTNSFGKVASTAMCSQGSYGPSSKTHAPSLRVGTVPPGSKILKNGSPKVDDFRTFLGEFVSSLSQVELFGVESLAG